jgi:hypothetical protein
LLREARKLNELLRTAETEPDPTSPFDGAVRTFIVVNGIRQPYVDYHAPIYEALSSLAIPYHETDEIWLAEIETWCRVKGLSTGTK